MTQSIVSLPYDTTIYASGAGFEKYTTSQVVQGIFDFEITEEARDYYIQQINEMISAASNYGFLAINAQFALLEQFQTAFNRLLGWSQLQYIDPVTGLEKTRFTDFTSGPDTIQGYLANIGTYTIVGNTTPINLGTNLGGFARTSDADINGPGHAVGVNPTTALPSGSTDPNSPNFVLTSSMDRYMAEEFNNIARILLTQGADVTDPTQAHTSFGLGGKGLSMALMRLSPSPTAAPLNLDLGFDLIAALNKALHVAEEARLVGQAYTQSDSIQQVLMVDYVSRGNEILFNEMSLLREAINTNDAVLGYLNSLQDLLNEKDPQKFTLKLQNLSSSNSMALPNTQYDEYEKATFNQVLGTLGIADANLSTLTDLSKDAFADFVNNTDGFVFTKARLVANLQALSQRITESAGTEGSRLKLAIDAITADLNLVTTVQAWIQDIQTGQEGDHQRHVNDAIVASQSFNDTQREELRRVMFVFEEFYKSATALLAKIHDTIMKSASFIPR